MVRPKVGILLWADLLIKFKFPMLHSFFHVKMLAKVLNFLDKLIIFVEGVTSMTVSTQLHVLTRFRYVFFVLYLMLQLQALTQHQHCRDPFEGLEGFPTFYPFQQLISSEIIISPNISKPPTPNSFSWLSCQLTCFCVLKKD